MVFGGFHPLIILSPVLMIAKFGTGKLNLRKRVTGGTFTYAQRRRESSVIGIREGGIRDHMPLSCSDSGTVTTPRVSSGSMCHMELSL
jgi:hypothetical protein